VRVCVCVLTLAVIVRKLSVKRPLQFFSQFADFCTSRQ